MDEETEDDGEEYCYHCGHYHYGDVSSGDWPSEGCSDYDYDYEEERSKK